MKKLFILFVALFLFGCTTPNELINQKKIYVGMSKYELETVVLFNLVPDEDAFLSGCYRKYFSEVNFEILSSSSKRTFYVFERVTVPEKTCYAQGDGFLFGVYDSYDAAYSVINSKLLDKYNIPPI